MKGLTFYDKQHIQKVLAQQSEVANIFNRFILSITPFLKQWADRSSDNVWLRNQVVEKCVDRELDKLQSLLLTNLTVFNIDAWKRSEMKNEDFFYITFSTCSLICSSSSFICTTIFCISAWLDLLPSVLISRPIS